LLRIIDAGLGKWARDKRIMVSYEEQEENIKFGSLEQTFKKGLEKNGKEFIRLYSCARNKKEISSFDQS
jgi:hypothetical protein